jgi:phosphatidate cytidylyltransferase
MALSVYLILIAYYALGAVLINKSNKTKNKEERKQSWLKFRTYFIIYFSLFSLILFLPDHFYYFSFVLFAGGSYELIHHTIKSKKYLTGIPALIILQLVLILFFHFCQLNQQILLFSLAIVSIFDAMSQLLGQLSGKRKLLPVISPNKTLGGLIGGSLSALLTAILLSFFLDINLLSAILLAMGISVFAFTGDFLASLCKRSFHIKDFSNLLPGQGGFLDRFDSLLFASIFVYLFYLWQA